MEETIGTRIRDLRIMRGLTQEQLAELLYRKKNTISQYENDRISMRVEDLELIAKALHVDMNYFFGTIGDADISKQEPVDIFAGLRDPRFRKEAVDILKIISNTELLFLPAGSV